jgi:predicted molibdopterin-dependent oxidoreductase YjgC
MRIEESNPLLPAIKRGKSIEIIVDGRSVEAFAGETVIAALFAKGIRVLGRKPGTGKPTSGYCCMGVCYECLVTINGRANTRACQTPVEPQMIIDTNSKQIR